MTCLTTAEVAGLKRCSVRYIRKLVSEGKLQASEKEKASNNRKEYLIPLSSLDEKTQRLYLKKLNNDMGLLSAAEPKAELGKKSKEKSVDEYSAEERAEIALWSAILKEWQAEREKEINKCDFDELFIANLKYRNRELDISPDILYRKYRAYLNHDLDGLIDKRGGWNKGNTAIPEVVWQAFLSIYLDDRQIKVPKSYETTKAWVKQNCPQYLDLIPSERTFRRQLEKIPESVIAYKRYGEKYYNDHYSPYIMRIYDELEANDCWIADNHTFDFFVTGEDGKSFRPYLTAFLDAKSGVIVGFCITDNPCSQATLSALRDGILKFGLPKLIYVDNGSEFLTHDIGGRGHRKKASWNKDTQPPTILAMLGIKMLNAIPKNAKAKNIERAFSTLCEHISKMFETYCGGSITKRPESLKYKIKNGIETTDEYLRSIIGTLINGGYNMELYGGTERRFKGKTRIDAWNESIQFTEFRKAAEDDLALLLARTTRYQKIGRNGVYISYKGERLYYMCDDIWKYQGQEVYVRFDPANLLEVRVYNKDDCYMFTAANTNDLLVSFLSEKQDEIKEGMQRVRHNNKKLREYARGLTGDIQGDKRIDMLAFEILKAEERQKEFRIIQPSKYVPVMSDKIIEQKPHLANIETVEVLSLEQINNNHLKRRG